MNYDKFLKEETPEKVKNALNEIRSILSDDKKLINRNYKRIVKSEEWKNTMEVARREKWENRFFHKRTRIKKYIIPEILVSVSPKYWNEAVKNDAYMKQYHPELVI